MIPAPPPVPPSNERNSKIALPPPASDNSRKIPAVLPSSVEPYSKCNDEEISQQLKVNSEEVSSTPAMEITGKGAEEVPSPPSMENSDKSSDIVFLAGKERYANNSEVITHSSAATKNSKEMSPSLVTENFEKGPTDLSFPLVNESTQNNSDGVRPSSTVENHEKIPLSKSTENIDDFPPPPTYESCIAIFPSTIEDFEKIPPAVAQKIFEANFSTAEAENPETVNKEILLHPNGSLEKNVGKVSPSVSSKHGFNLEDFQPPPALDSFAEVHPLKVENYGAIPPPLGWKSPDKIASTSEPEDPGTVRDLIPLPPKDDFEKNAGVASSSANKKLDQNQDEIPRPSALENLDDVPPPLSFDSSAEVPPLKTENYGAIPPPSTKKNSDMISSTARKENLGTIHEDIPRAANKSSEINPDIPGRVESLMKQNDENIYKNLCQPLSNANSEHNPEEVASFVTKNSEMKTKGVVPSSSGNVNPETNHDTPVEWMPPLPPCSLAKKNPERVPIVVFPARDNHERVTHSSVKPISSSSRSEYSYPVPSSSTRVASPKRAGRGSPHIKKVSFQSANNSSAGVPPPSMGENFQPRQVISSVSHTRYLKRSMKNGCLEEMQCEKTTFHYVNASKANPEAATYNRSDEAKVKKEEKNDSTPQKPDHAEVDIEGPTSATKEDRKVSIPQKPNHEQVGTTSTANENQNVSTSPQKPDPEQVGIEGPTSTTKEDGRVTIIELKELNLPRKIRAETVLLGETSLDEKIKDAFKIFPPFLSTMCVIQFLLHYVVNNEKLVHFLMFHPLRRYEIWRFFTPNLVDCSHVWINIVVEIALAHLVEKKLGWKKTAKLYFVSALFGILVTTLIDPWAPQLGASEAVVGIYVYQISNTLMVMFMEKESWRHYLLKIILLVWIFATLEILLPVVFGLPLDPWKMHWGGAIGGFMMGLILTDVKSRKNTCCGGLFQLSCHAAMIFVIGMAIAVNVFFQATFYGLTKEETLNLSELGYTIKLCLD